MKPSRFIMNSNYATTQSKEGYTLSVTIPDSISILPGDFNSFSISNSIAVDDPKFTGLRVSFSTSKDGNRNRVLSSTIRLRCIMNYQSGATTKAVMRYLFANFSFGEDLTHRTKFYLNVYPIHPSDWDRNALQITGAGQTLTAHVSTFLSPFES